MNGVNNFDVLKKMSLDNKDIRMGVDIVQAKAVKAGTQITIGIGGDIVAGVMLGDLRAVLLVFDKKQFDILKTEMEAQ